MIEENGNVRIGLSDFGQSLLGEVEHIVLPAEGSKLRKGNIRIRGRGIEVSLNSPIEGYVVEVNEKLKLKPSLLNKYPYTMGWLFVVRPIHLSHCIKHLYAGSGARQWYEEETNRLSSMIAEIKGVADVGVTMQDGGRLNLDLLSKLRRNDVHHILKQFFNH